MSSINKDNEECIDAMLFRNSHLFPMVFKAAIELDLFSIIAKAGPGAHISAAEVASQLPTNSPSAPSMLDRVLRFLASHSVINYSLRTLEDGRTEKLYGLTPASQLFVGNNDEDESLWSDLLALPYHPAVQQVSMRMKDAILEETGDLFKKVHGVTMFEYMRNDPTFNNVFNKSIAANSQITMKGILEVYRGYDELASLVDVAGGTGKCLHMITSKYPYIKGINYDLPHDIIHNWNDENCIKILKNCHEALSTNGKLIIITAMLPEEPDSSKSSMFVSGADSIMFMLTSSGKERTTKELEALCKKAGFSNFQVACDFQGVRSVMEFYK
ncbi:hypothetical protein Pint_04715 [Pistacia integerrima]|uniref:Uncharacterized protein n=1 Tax=Pistacia integerrima TaxID=434235 RepID=A0ACC0Z4D2_9ROSI|nr:hypothetical protein Pint_04715 [Pistacia integerrima]